MAEHPTTPRPSALQRVVAPIRVAAPRLGYGKREMVWDLCAHHAELVGQCAASSIVTSRSGNDDFRPLGHLVEHVVAQPYASSIAGATSGTALLVARNVEADWTHEALRIDVDLSGSIRFALPEKRLVKATTFECNGTKIVGTFESFLRKAAWVTL